MVVRILEVNKDERNAHQGDLFIMRGLIGGKIATIIVDSGSH